MSCPAGTIVAYGGFLLPNGWLWANGQAVSRTMYWALLAALISEATITISIASPAVISWTSHGLSNDWPVQFSTTGSLPAGIVAGTTYYVTSATTNTFEIATTPGGSPIATSGSQSGTQTGIFAPYGDGDGATTFNVPDMRGSVPFGLDDLGGAAAAGRITAAGSGIYGTTPGATGGSETVTLTTEQIPAHTHLLNVLDFEPVGAVATYACQGGSTYPIYGNRNSTSTGGGDAHNNMPPTIMVNYIVKYC